MGSIARTILIAALLAAPLSAGVIYDFEIKAHTASGVRTSKRRIVVEGGRLRSDFGDSTGHAPAVTVLFHSDSRRMITLLHDDKTYLEIDQAFVAALSEAVEQAKETLQNLPAEQRAKLEELMKGGPGAAMEPLQVRPTGTYGSFNGYSCEIQDIYRGGKKVRELCVADRDDVPGGHSAGAAIEGMQDLGKQMLSVAKQGLPTPLPNPFAYWDQVDGFVVASRRFRDGELHLESSLKSVRLRAIDPAEFEPPAGYKKQTLDSRMP